MVSAWIAEITSFEITVIAPDKSVRLSSRLDLIDEGDPHGVDLDEADDWLERHGYLMKPARWQEHGSFYKSVLITVEDYRRREAARGR